MNARVTPSMVAKARERAEALQRISVNLQSRYRTTACDRQRQMIRTQISAIHKEASLVRQIIEGTWPVLYRATAHALVFLVMVTTGINIDGERARYSRGGKRREWTWEYSA